MCTKRHNPTLWRAKPALGSTAGNPPLAWVNSKWTGNFKPSSHWYQWHYKSDEISPVSILSTEITDTWIVEACVVSCQSYLLEQTYSIKYQDYRSKSPAHSLHLSIAIKILWLLLPSQNPLRLTHHPCSPWAAGKAKDSVGCSWHHRITELFGLEGP